MRDFLFYIIVSPYSKANCVATSAGNFSRNLKEIVDAHEEIRSLKTQNQNLICDLSRLKMLEIENRRFSELLGYKRKIDAHLPRKTVLARVMMRSPQQYYRSLIIDKGSDDGLAENMAVFGFYKSRFGIIGRLANVEKNVSMVITITSRISKIPSRVTSACVDGVISGCETNELDMMWLPSDAEIKIGDEVVTSSASDIFPAGIPVGIIVSITQTGHLPFKKASVKPYIPPFQVTDVFIEAGRKVER